MRAVIWKRSKDLRPNLPVTIRRVKNYTATQSHKDESGVEIIDKLGTESGFQTELEILGKILPVAPCKLESNGDWLVAGWIKALSPLMDKYETASFVEKPKTITDADSLIRAVVTSEKYK